MDIFKSRFQGEKAMFYPGERIASRFFFKNNPSATFISPSGGGGGGGGVFVFFFLDKINSIPGTLQNQGPFGDGKGCLTNQPPPPGSTSRKL